MQFNLLTFFEGSATEILFNLGFSGKKNKFRRLLFKKLGIDTVSDKLERGVVQVQFFKAKALKKMLRC